MLSTILNHSTSEQSIWTSILQGSPPYGQHHSLELADAPHRDFRSQDGEDLLQKLDVPLGRGIVYRVR